MSRRAARWVRSLAVTVLLGGLVAPPTLAGPEPEVDSAQAWTPARMMEASLPGDVAIAPDGARVAYTVWRSHLGAGESADRGRIYLSVGDATAAILTPEGVSSFSPRWSPDGRRLAYLSDASGRTEIWMLTPGGDADAAKQVTDSASGVESFRWLPDGRSLIFVARQGEAAGPPPPTHPSDAAYEVDSDLLPSRLWRLELPAGETAPAGGIALTPPDFHVAASMGVSYGYMLSGYDVSPDGRSVVFTRAPTSRVNDWQFTDVALLDLLDGSVREIAASRRAEGSPIFSPDGRSIAYTASDDPPTASFAARVWVAAVEGGPPRALALTADERPRLLGWSADGLSIYVSEIRGTSTRISALPVDGGAPRDLDGGERVATAISIDPSRRRIGFVGERSDQAPEVFVSALSAWSPRQVSALGPQRGAPPLGRTERLRWRSDDGLEIEGLLTYPVGYVAGQRCPLLLIVHGGPTYYFVDDSIASPSEYPIAAFAARGFAVLRANPRGSSGRGRAFRFANRRDWGGGDFRDLMAGVDKVIAMGIADPHRLGVMGWSYGGYMTAWIITQTRRFRAASVGAGISDLPSFSGTSDIFDFASDYFGGPPWEQPDLYVERSPLFHLAGVTTPTLIQQGERDRRVPTSQGLELYRALERLGVETRFVLYPRQGHAIDEPALLLDVAERNLEWFERHLAPSAAPTRSPP